MGFTSPPRSFSSPPGPETSMKSCSLMTPRELFSTECNSQKNKKKKKNEKKERKEKKNKKSYLLFLLETQKALHYQSLELSAWGDFAPFPAEDIWQFLESFLVVTTGELLLVSGVEDRDATKHPTVHRMFPRQRMVPPPMSVVPRLSNPSGE